MNIGSLRIRRDNIVKIIISGEWLTREDDVR